MAFKVWARSQKERGQVELWALLHRSPHRRGGSSNGDRVEPVRWEATLERTGVSPAGQSAERLSVTETRVASEE